MKEVMESGVADLAESKLEEFALPRKMGRIAHQLPGLGFMKSRRRSRDMGSWLFGPGGRVTADDLRRYIVLSEVLQPPLALRENW